MPAKRSESVLYQLLMLVLCLVTLTILAVEALTSLPGEVRLLLRYADDIICAIFFLDFLVSLRSAPNKWRYLYTWGWLDLISSIPTFEVARWGRAARVARIFRVMRSVRVTRILGGLLLTRRAESTFLAASLIGLLLVLASSVAILQVENAQESNIRTASDALWWALTTITTVGYGDRYPITSEGRFVAALLMFAGVGLFGLFSGLLAAWFVAPSSEQEHNELEALRVELREIRTLLEKRK
jgi:voltage-gated potassium channel